MSVGWVILWWVIVAVVIVIAILLAFSYRFYMILYFIILLILILLIIGIIFFSNWSSSSNVPAGEIVYYKSVQTLDPTLNDTPISLTFVNASSGVDVGTFTFPAGLVQTTSPASNLFVSSGTFSGVYYFSVSNQTNTPLNVNITGKLIYNGPYTLLE